ncbi:uncharacterized protein LOC6538155 [Drosophila yakuba]|uniref:Uncharacterized protein n=1 Tax=Drosophila yakuba TaxID=7245 RepID=B4PQR2_DROYA|nr:uncharacterized protein LOC6538155 [Drosophila yakuba]EDW98401.2 uncharacterized protein Dyak_GE10504 [Drosophila yakuba]
MRDPNFLRLIISLIFFFGNATAMCYIDMNVLTSNYVVFSTTTGVFDILTSDIVATRSVIYLVCDDATPPIQLVCQPNGRFNGPFPRAGCRNPLKPLVEQVADTSCPKTMYRVGYRMQDRFMELYRSCYDSVSYAAQFAVNKIYPSKHSAQRQPKAFTSDGAMTARAAAAYQVSRIQDRFVEVLGPRQKYVVTSSNPFHHGHLAPSGDYSFDQLQKATNKLRNVVPQYSNINNGNWKRIEFWVKKLLARHRFDVLQVVTGALGVHSLASDAGVMTPMYLLNGDKIPVPEWMYKVVSHSSGQKWVILTYNDGWSTERPNPGAICQEIPCDSDLKLSGAGFTFCCQPDGFINKNVPHLKGVF